MNTQSARSDTLLLKAAAILTIALKSEVYWLTGSVGLLSDALESGVNLAVISIGLASTALFALPVTSVFVHTIEVTGDMAGTWHVEPNHTPGAGKLTTVWVALTRKGGSILPR